MARHERWLESARRHSKKSNFPHYRMSAILVKGGRVMSIGVNKSGSGHLKAPEYTYISHTMHRGIHAELAAILAANEEDVRGATLYVSGETSKGGLIMSKPCLACQSILKRYGIKDVFYHDREGSVNRLDQSAC